MLTRDGVGVSGGGFLSGAAALRFRRGVAGASGFLKTGSPLATVEDLTLLALGFFATVPSAEASALRFFVELVELSGAATVELADLVERRKDILMERRPIMQQCSTAKYTRYTKFTCSRVTSVLERS